MPLSVWYELVGDPEEGISLVQPSLPWWERLTPLASDCELALEMLHCTPREYYLRTNEAERMLIKLHLAYRQKQRAMAEQLTAARARQPEFF